MSIQVKKLTNETFQVGDTKYYIEYRSNDFVNKLEYRLINLTDPMRRQVMLTTDHKLNLIAVKGNCLTAEEAAVCVKKGMIVDESWIVIRKPSLFSKIKMSFFNKQIVVVEKAFQ